MAEKRNSLMTDDGFVLISRVFDAPRELVFEAWADRERLSRWYAPRGCTITFRSFDFREGGAFHSCIRSPQGHECWCTGVYREIVAPERIVFSMAVSNEKGDHVQPTDVGMDPDWPRETVVTVTFDDLDGKTKLTLHQTVGESLAKRTGAHPSWIQMLDGLAENLARGRSAESLSRNKQTVQNYMDAFTRTDHTEILSCLTDDVEWVTPGMFHVTGKAAFDREIESDAFTGSPTIRVTRMTEEDDVVVAEGSVRCARRNGGELTALFCDVFVMQKAKIRRLTSYLMEVNG